ncbi:MAG: D-alanyl-D-alanine carboxypeptidase [Dorea sp.]|nr:D-alanyl-D-alanine carboxypeptidase [Dorea sp.]
MKRSKRLFSFLFAILFVVAFICQDGMMLQVSATDVTENSGNAGEDSKKDRDKEYQETIDRVMNMPVKTDKIPGWPTGPSTHGEAAIVMEVGTGEILYSKNIDKHYYPASITKILTALVALENSEMTDEVRITDDCVDFLNWDDAWIGLKAGNKISMEDAMHAMLMASANEAAYAIAQSVGENKDKDYDWFIKQMNKKVKELGGTNSHFVNPHGLHDEKHYTCARDMALIGRELFKYPDFFRIAQTPNYVIKKSKTTEEHVFQQYHKMLLEYEDDYYPYAIGGKLGYTDQALSTLVTMTEKDGMQLVIVVLKTYGVNIYPDTTNLAEYAYQNFDKFDVKELDLSKDIGGFVDDEEHPGYVVLPYGTDPMELEVELIPEDPNIVDSIEAIAEYSYNGHPVGSARVTLSDRYVAIHKKQTEENAQTTVVETKPEEGEASYMHQMSQTLVPYVTLVMENRKVQLLILVIVVLIFLLTSYLKLRSLRRKKLRQKRMREQKMRQRKLREQQLRQLELERQQEEALRKQARKELIIRMRREGYSDDEIRNELKKEKERLTEEKTRVFP